MPKWEKTNYGWGPNYKICVAGMGRVGATMLTRYLSKKIGRDNVTGVHRRDFVEFNGKVVFLFGNPYNSAISFRKLRRLRGVHFRHMGKPIKDKRLFVVEDIFGFEELFDDWYRKHEFPLATVRYKTMWENIDKLADFLELDLSDFPKFKQRRTDWKNLKEIERKKMKETYDRLALKIESAKDFKVWI